MLHILGLRAAIGLAQSIVRTAVKKKKRERFRVLHILILKDWKERYWQETAECRFFQTPYGTSILPRGRAEFVNAVQTATFEPPDTRERAEAEADRYLIEGVTLFATYQQLIDPEMTGWATVRSIFEGVEL